MASLLSSAVFQLITFIAFNDNMCKDQKLNEIFVKCTVDEGSAFAISASLFYLLSGIVMLFIYAPKVPLISFEEGWRGDKTANNNGGTKNAQTEVVVHRVEQAVPNLSTAPLSMGLPPIRENFINTGASVAVGGAEEDTTLKNNFGVQL
eukprot:111209_1